MKKDQYIAADHKKSNTDKPIQLQNKFKNSINLKLPLFLIAFISSIYPPLVGVFCLFVYIMQGRISGYYPTISETGTEYPNSNFFAQFMSTGAMTSMASLFFYFNYFILKRRSQSIKKSFIERLLFLLIFTSGAGIIMLGFSPINEHHSRHLLSAVTGFLSILAFELITFLNDPNQNKKKWVRVLRWTFFVLALTGFLTFAAAKWVFRHRIDITISTFAEWGLLVFMLLIWPTWKEEINSLHFSVVIL